MNHNAPGEARSARAGRLARFAAPLTAAAASLLAAGALAGPALAGTAPANGSPNYSFTTLDNHKDRTFNQLLGINDSGLIAGYLGSGQTGHPNKGYTLSDYGYGTYHNENVPGAAQTQVTGLNDAGQTVGFWVDAKGDNFAFYTNHGQFHEANFPTHENAKPQVDQLLGINDQGAAVGFYTDKQGTNHGYWYSMTKHQFHSIYVNGDSNVTAAAIDNLGDVAGSATNRAGTTEGFLLRSNGRLVHLNVPGATSTQAFGVNTGDEVVGDYVVGTGSSAVTHGFVWAPGFGFQTVDAPSGTGGTTLNGINDRGTVVGFYTDTAGNTDGLLATAHF